MIGALIAGLVKKKVAGELIGMIVSKTQWGASAAAGSAIWASIAPALNGDNEAIGIIVVAVFGWITAIYGRLKAKMS